MKAPMLLAVARHRGTEISNPFPSSREMSELRLWRKHTRFVGEPRRNRKPRRGTPGFSERTINVGDSIAPGEDLGVGESSVATEIAPLHRSQQGDLNPFW